MRSTTIVWTYFRNDSQFMENNIGARELLIDMIQPGIKVMLIIQIWNKPRSEQRWIKLHLGGCISPSNFARTGKNTELLERIFQWAKTILWADVYFCTYFLVRHVECGRTRLGMLIWKSATLARYTAIRVKRYFLLIHWSHGLARPMCSDQCTIYAECFV